MPKPYLIISFKNARDISNTYNTLICNPSIFNKINNYAKKHWDEDYKEEYDFSNIDGLQEVSSLFFADYEPVNELERKYVKHNTGCYNLEKNVNYHNIVQLEEDKFLELIAEWKYFLEKLSGKTVLMHSLIPQNKHDPTQELNSLNIDIC